MTTIALHNAPGDHPMSPRTGAHIGDAVPQLSDAATQRYERAGMAMNAVARGIESSNIEARGGSELLRKDIIALDERFATTEPITDSIKTYRAIRGVDKMIGTGNPVGRSFTDRGYGSTAVERDLADFFISGGYANSAMMEVTTPRGFRALRISDGEIVLPRHTRYQITGDEVVNGNRTLALEVVSQK